MDFYDCSSLDTCLLTSSEGLVASRSYWNISDITWKSYSHGTSTYKDCKLTEDVNDDSRGVGGCFLIKCVFLYVFQMILYVLVVVLGVLF